LLTRRRWKFGISPGGWTTEATDEGLAYDLRRELHRVLVLGGHVPQRVTGKGEVDGDPVDGAEQSEAVRGGDGRIEHGLVTAGGAVGWLQVEGSGVRSGPYFHLEALVEVVH